MTDAADKWAGKGEILPKDTAPVSEEVLSRSNGDDDRIPNEYWSNTYQWLPANLAFQDDGTVKFTSYINNLNPKKHPEIYRAIEKLIDISIPAWDGVLHGRARPGKGQDHIRFPDAPAIDYDDEDDNFEPLNEEILAAYEKEHGEIKVDTSYIEPEEIPKQKWKEIRDPLLQEPNDPKPLTFVHKKRLFEKFKKTGLQVIVKMATIELTPEKPEFPAGGWHVRPPSLSQMPRFRLTSLHRLRV